MAVILGLTKEARGNPPAKYLFLLGVTAVSLTGFMLISDESWGEHLFSLFAAIAVILVLIGFGLSRMNPMLWKRLFHKTEYKRYVQGQGEIIQVLRDLDDDYQVLCGFTLELIHVEFLVLCPGNIFVLAQVNTQEALRVENDQLMAGNHSLQKLTAKLWRASHLLNLIVKKGYAKDIMPKPVLIVPNRQDLEMREFDGIAIVHPKELTAVLAGSRTQDVSEEMVLGFSEYLYKRYIV